MIVGQFRERHLLNDRPRPGIVSQRRGGWDGKGIMELCRRELVSAAGLGHGDAVAGVPASAVD